MRAPSLLLFILGLLISCNEVNFGSKVSTAESPVPTPPPPAPVNPPPASPPPGCDLSGDFVKLEFPADIQNCVNQGKVYNFKKQRCSTVMQQRSFTCDFNGVAQAVTRLGIEPTNLQNARARGDKLIGCGEDGNGGFAIAQLFNPRESGVDPSTCRPSSLKFTTLCFVAVGVGPLNSEIGDNNRNECFRDNVGP